MKRKIGLTILFMISLITMLFPWFKGIQGIEEVYGVIMLENPIALTCIFLVFFGIWTNFGKNSDIVASIGMLGIIVMEIYEFLTWHILPITGHFDLSLSIDLCYPEFYYALFCIVMTYIVFQLTNKKVRLF